MVGRHSELPGEERLLHFDIEHGDVKKIPTRCCHYRRKHRGLLAAQVEVPRKMLRVWCDFGASIMIILGLLAVPDTVLALFSSVASVYIWDVFAPNFSMNLTWSAVSLMLAFPLQNAIREAYKRRESALQALMDLRATMLNVYLAHTTWDWPGASSYGGRQEDGKPKEEGGTGIKKGACNVPLPVSHNDNVKELLFRTLDALQDFLLVPRSGHPRSDLACGRKELREITGALDQGRETVMRLLGRFHHACENLKAAGLPATEASRINQYTLEMFKSFETLWAFKTYYTPIALRGLLRVFIQIVPFVYGPYWLHIAKGDADKPQEKSLVFAASFSIMITCLLIVMSNLQEQVEDPFDKYRDTIRVKEEIDLAKRAISMYAEDSRCSWHDCKPFAWDPAGCQDNSESENSTSSAA